MRFFRLVAIGVVLLVLVSAILGMACAGAQGEQGPPGAAGASGPAGPQGPQGEQGLQGIQGLPGTPGIGVEWVGEWDNSVSYAKYDAVGYQGSSYVSKQDNNVNNVPTDMAWWDLWVAKGETGATGPQGEAGLQGEQGPLGPEGPVGSQGPQGDPGPNMIVAMGIVGIDGSVSTQYNIAGCEWSSYYNGYLVALTGIDFYNDPYVVVVTPGATFATPRTCGYGRLGGFAGVLVHVFDSAGNPIQGMFSIMVLECPD